MTLVSGIKRCRFCNKETYHLNVHGAGESPLMCCTRCGNDEQGTQHKEVIKE